MIATKTATLTRDFFAGDTQGRTIRLSTYNGKKHVVLVFTSGLDCLYSRQEIAKLRQDYQEFIDRNAEVIVVGPENSKELLNYWRSERIPYIGIPDPAHTIARLFEQKVDPIMECRMPALLVIDKESRIRYQRHGISMNDIPANDDILSLLDDLNKETAYR